VTFPDEELLTVARSPLTDIFASPATLSVVVPAAIISNSIDIDSVEPYADASRSANDTIPLLPAPTGFIIELSYDTGTDATSIISDADIVTVTVILLPTVPLAELIDIEACSSALA
jgi:hypothetical protein